MSDSLQALKSQAKISMQELVDRALVQDEVSRYKRLVFRRAYISIGVLISLPMTYLVVTKLFQHLDFHGAHVVSSFNFIVMNGKSIREIYAPEIYFKDQKLRPYETEQFR